MSKTYDINMHTHFNAPEAKGRTYELLNLNEPTSLILVAEGRIWFHEDHLVLQIEGTRQESPFDDLGSCIMSYPVEGCNFFTEVEAAQISGLIDIDAKLLRQAIG